MITNLRDCYISLGGDFDEVLGRLRREQTVQKFVCKFVDDKSFNLFEESMKSGDYAEALRAVHTLKGVCQNLSFTKLYETSSLLTKALKENRCEEAVAMMPQLSKDYAQTVSAIEEYKRLVEE